MILSTKIEGYILVFFLGGGGGGGVDDVDLGGYKLGWKRYTHKPVSPLMRSEAPCCGGGLSVN